MDLITAPQGNVDLGRFTEKRYKSIVKYKTAFYSFYLPVAAAMYMAGIDGEKEHAHAKKIVLEMGEFFQIQVERHGALAENRLQLCSFPALQPLRSFFSAPPLPRMITSISLGTPA